MNVWKKVLLDCSVQVERFYHGQDETHHDPEEETAPYYALNFVEQGNFQLQVGREKWILDERKIFVTHPTMNYRFNHFEERPTDVCLSIKFSEDLAEEIFSLSDFNLKTLSPVILLNNRLAYLRWQIARLVEIADNAMEVETLAAEMLSAAGINTTEQKIYNTRQLGWYAERVEAICHLFEKQYEDKHSLNSISRFVGMSSFHLTRVFRELTNQTPHQFLINIRLIKAAEYLLDGVSVTEVCFACGFNNLSYFIRLFQRNFGVTPLQFQKKKIKAV
jgi:AraC-like DNA-binding protein